MAQKDIYEKILLSYGDVFADCENALAYGGRQRLRGEDLHPAPTESYYHGEKQLHNQFVDVSFYLMADGEIKAQFLIGNETDMRRLQVLRKASYQGGIYRLQIEAERPVYPVIGMVIDWTRKRTWIPLSLHELLIQEGRNEEGGISREDLDRVDDVKLEVYHMRNLPEEIRQRFVSDMGFVVDFLNDGNLENRRDQKIIHVEALCGMMEALTGDERFTSQVEVMLKMQEEGKEIHMCEYIDMLEKRGEIRGETRGLARGEEIGKEIGENRLAALLQELYTQGREEEARKAIQDKGVRTKLYKEFCMG